MAPRQHEQDTSSELVTKARNLTVFDDNDEFAGAVQTFVTLRGTEVEAIKNAMNPTRADEWEWHELVKAMLAKGMVWCGGRCQRFLHFSEFSVDSKNTDRLSCHSFCKECRAAMSMRQYHGKKPDASHWKPRKKRGRKRN